MIITPATTSAKPASAARPGYRRGQRHHRARYPDAVVEQARTLHDRGMSRAGIARHLGVPYHTLRDWLEYRTRR
jgi:DNA invertase Pin-like site-specific DNA recombinase